ncbi:MAG TPA: hypothetical protein PKX41_10500, partial [Anaerolineaceae bacterium]|nr:hypothetical protein [Anaerolineaceae bacterium]
LPGLFGVHAHLPRSQNSMPVTGNTKGQKTTAFAVEFHCRQYQQSSRAEDRPGVWHGAPGIPPGDDWILAKRQPGCKANTLRQPKKSAIFKIINLNEIRVL